MRPVHDQASTTESTGAAGGKKADQYATVHRAIAKAALVELSTNGFERLDMAAIAQRADVGERTVYRHYPTKLDVAVAGIEQMPSFAGWADGDDPIAERLRRGLAIGAAHHDYLAPILSTAMLNRKREPKLLATLEDCVMRERENQIALLISDGQRIGEIREGVRASAISATIDGLLIAHHRGSFPMGRGKARVKKLFDEIWPLMASDVNLYD